MTDAGRGGSKSAGIKDNAYASDSKSEAAFVNDVTSRIGDANKFVLVSVCNEVRTIAMLREG